MKRIYLLLFFSSLFFMANVSAQQIRYVKQGGTGDGSSWDNASGDLQAMINASDVRDQVWVAKGVYKPDRRPDMIDNPNYSSLSNPNRDPGVDVRFNSFLLKAKVAVYGGFAGNEPTNYFLGDRDFVANETILSGDLNGNDDPLDPVTKDDNTYHVVMVVGDMGQGSILDGFTVRDGQTEAATGTTNAIRVHEDYNVPSTRSPGIIAYYVDFIEFRNLIIRNNTHVSSGQNAGALYMFTASGDLTNVQFIDNKIDLPSGSTVGHGGAMYTYGVANDRAKINFRNVSFIGNESFGSGGAIYMGQYSDLKFYDCLFQGNKSGSTGGVFYLGSGTSNADFYNTDFINNQGQSSGGVIYAVNSGRLNINGGVFKGNTIVAQSSGGAIYASALGLILNIKGVTFEDNVCNNYGGALYLGGGTYTIENSVFKNNSSRIQGGAIYQTTNTVASTKIISSIFEGNETRTSNGGAIYLNAAEADVISSQFLNNVSNLSGAAFAIAGATAKARIINTLFYGNEAQTTGGGGGAVYMFTNSRIDMYNSTLVNNRVPGSTLGGAFYVAVSATLNLYNTLSYFNRASSGTTTMSRHDIYPVTGANISLKNTITEYYGTTDATLGNVVGQDPLFISTVIGNPNFMEVNVGSPIIDKGVVADVPVSLDYDVLGKGRVHNGIIDIGAVEYLGAAGATTVYAVYENLANGETLGANHHVLNGVSGEFELSPISDVPNSGFSTITKWEIVEGNESGAFVIDEVTGVITVANSAPLNYEVTPRFDLKIRVQGDLPVAQPDYQIVTVIVNILNDLLEKPETPAVIRPTPVFPDLNNVYVVNSYSATIGGIAEANSMIIIYVGQKKTGTNDDPLDDDANWDYREHPVRVQVSSQGRWEYRFFPEEHKLDPGFTRFKVVGEVKIKEVDPITGENIMVPTLTPESDWVVYNIKLYGGGTAGLLPTNILTPNGDSFNDVWKIPNLREMYPNHEILVYDKVGKVVFRWDSKVDGEYNDTWEGTYRIQGSQNGQPVPSGTYYYDIKVANDGEQGLDRVKGKMLIINR